MEAKKFNGEENGDFQAMANDRAESLLLHIFYHCFEKK
jgi:hypothetical protein